MTKSYLFLLCCFLFSYSAKAQVINFPDIEFKLSLISQGVDTNGDGAIDIAEAEATDNLGFLSFSITDMTGLSHFKNITSLTVRGTQAKNLDIAGFVLLEEINLENNDLDSIDLTGLSSLKSWYSFLEGLEKIDFSNLPALENITISSHFNLMSLNFSNLPSLTNLNCTNNSTLTSLDLSDLSGLATLDCGSNDALLSVNLEGLHALNEMDCYNNPSLLSLDLEDLTSLRFLGCSGCSLLNQLDLSNSPLMWGINALNTSIEYMNIANGGALFTSVLTNLDAGILNYICVDDTAEETWFKDLFPLSTAIINTNCNFSYGGNFHEIVGEVNFEETGDCGSATVVPVSQLAKFEITNASNQMISSQPVYYSNEYVLILPVGDFNVSPILVNDLFNIDPANFNVTFPAATDTIIQNFCLSPNGTPRVDLDIKLIPLQTATAGFEADYKLIFRNKGNTTSSGTVTVNYQDSVMHFVQADLPTSQSGFSLSHDYVDLQPFESREMILTLKLNSLMDQPPLFADNVITTSAVVTPLEDEFNLNDNSTIISEKVVSSYDPNDKRCLQGDFVSADISGDYVDYMIRFENTGTAPARNITITDTLNETMFDPSSIRVVDASHSVYMQQRGNFVELIFNDIYLPFDDDDNDGYVVFTVRTKDDLVVGDSLLNNADIFFDFNWPIRTNTAASVLVTDMDMDGYHNLEDCDDTNADINPSATDIPGNGIDEDCNGTDATSSTIDLAEESLDLYPNPATHILYAKRPFNGAATFRSVDGRVVLSALMQNSKLDISGVPGGFYFLELQDGLSNRIYIEKLVIKD